jgi:hypothetical protein
MVIFCKPDAGASPSYLVKPSVAHLGLDAIPWLESVALTCGQDDASVSCAV